uniref:Uncharacterized protein n=1 Tax=Glossina austeni TaxID=7395 RepID=A0A1A9VDD1_GLOAU
MIGNNLVASLTVGGLTTTGVVDTGATRSIIRKDMIGFISRIIATKASGNTIQMADGSLRDSNEMITVERSSKPNQSQVHTVNPKLITASARKTTLNHLESPKTTKANRTEITQPKSKAGIMATTPITRSYNN